MKRVPITPSMTCRRKYRALAGELERKAASVWSASEKCRSRGSEGRPEGCRSPSQSDPFHRACRACVPPRISPERRTPLSARNVGRPFHVLELPDKYRPQPQCRMPDYAASGVASIGITAFSVILFRHNQAGMRQRNRAPFAHVSKRCATNLGPLV